MVGKLSAVILDFDGVVVDTETEEWQLWREFYAAYGLELPPELWSQRVGASDALAQWHPLAHFETVTGRPLPALVERDMTRRFFERCHQRSLEPGVESLIERASAAGLKMGVASSNSRFWVESFLVQHSIRSHFSAVRTIEDVVAGKPQPDLYWSAAQGLGVSPEQCMAIEDSPNGCRAAIAAGIGCVVAVPNRLTARMPFPDGVNVLLETLEGFDPLAVFGEASGLVAAL